MVLANEVVQERLVEALEAVDAVKEQSQGEERGGRDEPEFDRLQVEKRLFFGDFAVKHHGEDNGVDFEVDGQPEEKGREPESVG